MTLRADLFARTAFAVLIAILAAPLVRPWSIVIIASSAAVLAVIASTRFVAIAAPR